MTNHATIPAIEAAATKPPTTPPAIAPELELLWDVEVGEEPDPDALGVRVDCETVDTGTMETVPVTSGESRRQCKIKISACVQSRRISHLLRLPPPRCSSCYRSVGLLSVRFPGTASKRRVEGCTHSCVDICPLGHSSAIWDGFREAG